MADIFGFSEERVPKAVLKPSSTKKDSPAKREKHERKTNLPASRAGKAKAARKSVRDIVTAQASSTPVGKENTSAAASPAAGVAVAPIVSPQAWIPKYKEKKTDRSIDDPEYNEAKQAWLSKMNAEFAEVDSYALEEEPVTDAAVRTR